MMDETPLTEMSLTDAYVGATNILATLNAFLKKHNTTAPRMVVLNLLYAQGDKPMRMGQITKKLCSSGGNGTGIVNKLLHDGLITKETLPNDRRVFVVSLSKTGRELVERVNADLNSLLEVSNTVFPDFLIKRL